MSHNAHAFSVQETEIAHLKRLLAEADEQRQYEVSRLHWQLGDVRARLRAVSEEKKTLNTTLKQAAASSLSKLKR